MRHPLQRLPAPSVAVTRWAVMIMTPIAALLGASFAARATVTAPTFQAQSVLSSATLNTAFAELAAAVNKPVVEFSGKKYSMFATTCAPTQSTFNGAMGGYETAKQLCEAACSSPSAHMCSGEEVIRSLQLGKLQQTLPKGQSHWFSGLVDNCRAWTDGTTTPVGNSVSWNDTTGGYVGPTTTGCSSPRPIACCD